MIEKQSDQYVFVQLQGSFFGKVFRCEGYLRDIISRECRKIFGTIFALK